MIVSHVGALEERLNEVIGKLRLIQIVLSIVGHDCLEVSVMRLQCLCSGSTHQSYRTLSYSIINGLTVDM